VINGAFEFGVEAILLSHLVTVYGMKAIEQSGVGGTPSRHFAEEEFSGRTRFALPQNTNLSRPDLRT
jgi:hypothetical protein